MRAYLNGQYLDKADAKLSVDDRGFVFGDGIYEVYRAIDGELFEAERHHRRLEHGLEALRLPRPTEADAGTLHGIALRLLRENGHDTGEATVYVQVPDRPGELARLFADAGQSGVNVEDMHIDHDPARPVGLVELVVRDDAAAGLAEALEARGWVAHR